VRVRSFQELLSIARIGILSTNWTLQKDIAKSVGNDNKVNEAATSQGKRG